MSVAEAFKKKWNSEDEVCPCCGKVIKVNRGLTKQNIKKLFKKPSIQDLMILIMLILVMFGGWAYNYDLKACQETIKNPAELCNAYYNAVFHGNFQGTELELTEYYNITSYNYNATS
jgi:hypothetical protein